MCGPFFLLSTDPVCYCSRRWKLTSNCLSLHRAVAPIKRVPWAQGVRGSNPRAPTNQNRAPHFRDLQTSPSDAFESTCLVVVQTLTSTWQHTAKSSRTDLTPTGPGHKIPARVQAGRVSFLSTLLLGLRIDHARIFPYDLPSSPRTAARLATLELCRRFQ